MGDRNHLLDAPEPVRYKSFDEEADSYKVRVVSGKRNSTADAENNRDLKTENSTSPENVEQRRQRETLSTRSDGYVELMRGSVPCPTCRGQGNIPKEQEHELVALIPVRDERLKPRRTWLYVLLATLFCLATAGLLIFFMFPRDVVLSSDVELLLPSNLLINKSEELVRFTVTYTFNITNSNFFTVSLSKSSMQVVFDNKVLNNTSVNQSVSVPIRGASSFVVDIGITFSKRNGFAQMVEACSLPYTFLHQRYMAFSTSTSYNFLGRIEETSLNTFPRVSCGNDTEAQLLKLGIILKR